jgi:hypothetical protein
VVVTGPAGTIVATTGFNVAPEPLSEKLRAGVDSLQWIASGRLLGLAAAISCTGWRMRRIGARRVLVLPPTVGLAVLDRRARPGGGAGVREAETEVVTA